MLIWFYVDDFSVAEPDKAVDAAKTKLLNVFEMRDIGPLRWMLGMRFTRDFEMGIISVTQDAYIDKLVEKFHIDVTGATPVIPIPSSRDMSLYTERATATKINLF